MSELSPAHFLVGARVFLRPPEPADLPLLLRWANDPTLRPLVGETRPMSAAGAAAYLQRLQEDPDRVWFVVGLRADGRIIGEAGLLRIFYPWRTADASLILGEQECWGQGYGREALALLLDYAFGTLNLHRLAVGVVGFNQRALAFWEAAGFRREGVQRDGYFCDHRYADFVMLSLLEDEWRPGP